MGFPDSVLTSGEKVVKQMHPHWRSVAVASLLGVLLVVACLWVVVATPNDSTGNTIQWIAVAVAVLVGIPMVVVPLLRWRTTHYVITTHRVMVRRGILNKTGKDITLSKITDVSFSQSLLDRMLGSGTLNVESAGDSPDEAFRDIPRSDQVQQLLNRLIDEDANKRAMRMAERAGYPPPREAPAPQASRSTSPEPTSTSPSTEPTTEPGADPSTDPDTEPTSEPTTEHSTEPSRPDPAERRSTKPEEAP